MSILDAITGKKPKDPELEAAERVAYEQERKELEAIENAAYEKESDIVQKERKAQALKDAEIRGKERARRQFNGTGEPQSQGSLGKVGSTLLKVAEFGGSLNWNGDQGQLEPTQRPTRKGKKGRKKQPSQEYRDPFDIELPEPPF